MSAHKQKGAVATDTGIVVGGRTSVGKLPGGPKMLLLAIVGLLLIGVATWTTLHFVQDTQKSTATCKAPTTDKTTINQAAAALTDPAKIEELGTIVQKIQQIHCYEQNANYVYVSLAYYIRTSDAADATVLLAKLQSAYNPKVGYDEAIDPYTKSIAVLKSEIAAINSTQNKGMVDSRAGMQL